MTLNARQSQVFCLHFYSLCYRQRNGPEALPPGRLCVCFTQFLLRCRARDDQDAFVGAQVLLGGGVDLSGRDGVVVVGALLDVV